jgi:hypothetical protein
MTAGRRKDETSKSKRVEPTVRTAFERGGEELEGIGEEKATK